jgi:hypothetical protein
VNIYSYLDFDLKPAPKGKHQIIRVENPILARPLEFYAHFAPGALTQPEAMKWAESLDAGGLSWRGPDVYEGFFAPDRSRWPIFDPEVFLGARNSYPAFWTSTPDPEAPASYAFVVGLGDGGVNRDHHGRRCHALAVRPGQ